MGMWCFVQLAVWSYSAAELKTTVGHSLHQISISLCSIFYSCIAEVQKTLQTVNREVFIFFKMSLIP